jgi:hypothetical protein
MTSPPPPTALHCETDGHVTAAKPRYKTGSTVTLVGVGFPGALGSNVTSLPMLSTAVHCQTAAHATAVAAVEPTVPPTL